MMLEDDENVTEDKDFYCEECKKSLWWKDKFENSKPSQRIGQSK